MISQEQQIFNQIDRAQNILITFGADWNGDALSSALALSLYLEKNGKKVEVAAAKTNDQGKTLLTFLPGYSKIKTTIDNVAKFIVSLNIANAKVDQIKYVVNDKTLNFIISPKDGWFTKDDVSSSSSGYQYDLIIALNTADLESLGQIYDQNIDFFYKTTIINIDHNSNNEEFGQVNFIELNAVATTEILFEIFKDYKPDLIDEDIATCLLAGIIYNTKSFKTPNLTPHVLATTSELIRLGARREEIVNHLYRSRDFQVLKLWGKILNNLKSANENKIIWSKISAAELGDDFNDDQLTEAIDELIINIPQAKVVIIFYGQKAVVYAIKNVNCLDLVKEFNPVGTRRVAYLNLAKNINEVESEIIELLKKRLDKLSL